MKSTMRKMIAWMLVFVLMSADVCAIAATLELPKALTIIDEEAFYGATTIDEVVLHDEVTEIRDRAFADSSLVEINLPESIEYIADDAFDGCEDVAITAEEDTYAYDWAVENGYIEDTATSDPLAPVIKTAEQENGTIIHLEWEKVEEASFYYVFWSTNNFEDEDYITRYVEETNYSIYGLQPNTKYYLCVAASDDIGFHYTEYFSVTTESIINHIPITGLSLWGESGDNVYFGGDSVGNTDRYTRNSIAVEPVTATNQNLKWISSNPDVVGIDENTGIITCLSLGISRITATTTDGSNISISGNYHVSPVAPTNVIATVDGTSIVVKWDAVADAEFYAVSCYDETNSESYDESEIAGLEYTFTRLRPHTEYRITVQSGISTEEYAFYGNSSQGIYVTTGEGEGPEEDDPVVDPDVDPLEDLKYTIENGEVTITNYWGNNDHVVIPSTIEGYPVVYIGDDAFYQDDFTSISIPDSVISIGEDAFYGCENLSTINIPEKLETIGNKAFWWCTSIETLTLPESVTSIGDGAFGSCSNLKTINLPNRITYIGNDLFSGCHNLEDINIPAGVTTIGSEAFFACEKLTCIDIPSSVTSIGEQAFGYCTGITSISIPAGVTYIAPQTFDTCSSLETIEIPESVKSIGSYAFRECSSLVSADLPNGITTIEDGIFAYCSSLTDVDIPKGITSIGEYAFINCFQLKDITIPSSVVSIGENAFAWCESLTNIVLPEGLTSISNSSFSSCSGLTTIVIPEGVITIGESAFSYCDGLISITLPESLETIGESAFYSCGNLQGIEIPKNITAVAESTFGWCESLSSVEIPSAVTTVGDSAFASCSNLVSVTNMEGVTIIGNSAFAACKKLESIDIPDGLSTLGSYVFTHCEALKHINLPEGLNSINERAFNYCVSLEEIEIPGSISTIGAYAFSNCESLSDVLIHQGVKTIENNAFVACYALRSIVIPEGVTNIENQAFYACIYLNDIFLPDTLISIANDAFDRCGYLPVIFGEEGSYVENYAKNQDIVFAVYEEPSPVDDFEYEYSDYNSYCIITDYIGNDSNVVVPYTIDGLPVTIINDGAFSGCETLTHVSIPKRITEIRFSAFYGCTNLKEVTVPERVRHLLDWAFGECESLETVEILGQIDYLADSTFNGCSSLINVSLPEGFSSIGGYAFSGCTNLTSIRIPQSITDIEESAFSGCVSLESLNIPAGVTNIGPYAFSGCDSLLNISIPEGVTELCDGLFDSCDNLFSVGFSDNLTCIGESAFKNCTNLEDIVIPKNVTFIGESAFNSCESLTNVQIPGGVTEVKDSTFAHCYGLKYVVINEGVSLIDASAFWNCSSMINIDLPDSLTAIGEDAFSDCSSLVSIDIPNGVTQIGGGAFWGCSALSKVNLNNRITTINDFAFWGCDNLMSIFVPESVEYIGEDAFGGSEEFCIYGVWGSYAETYAADNGISFNAGDYDANGSETVATVSLNGFVLTEDGTGIRGANVLIYRQGTNTLVGRATSATDGSWSIDGIRAYWNYDIKCIAAPYTFEALQYSAYAGNATVPDLIGTTEAKHLQLDTEVIRADAVATEQKVSIIANSDWNVSVNNDWIIPNVMNGTGNGEIIVSLTANEGDLRTGSFQVSTEDFSCTVFVVQIGETSVRLSTPTITSPAVDNESVEYGEITVSWEAVENAGYYVISLRDLTTDELLIFHSTDAVTSSTSALLSAEYFDAGKDYRVAVGAVPAGLESTDSTVGWCERLFTVPAIEEAESATLFGYVYAKQYIDASVDADGNEIPERISEYPLEGAFVTIYKEGDEEDTTIATVSTDINGKWVVENCEIGANYYMEVALEEGSSLSLTHVTAVAGENSFGTFYVVVGDSNDVNNVYTYYQAGMVVQDYSDFNSGLFAEYYQYSNDNDIWKNENKRWEGVVNTIDFSWSNARSSEVLSQTTNQYHYLNTKRYDGSGTQDPVRYVRSDKFAAQFNGVLGVWEDGEYDLRLTGDDAVRLKIKTNGSWQEKEDGWWFGGSKKVAELKKLYLRADTAYPLCIQYMNMSGSANLKLEIRKSGEKEYKIATADYFYCHKNVEDDRQNHVSGEWFDTKEEMDKINQQLTAKELSENFCGSLINGMIDTNLSPFFDVGSGTYEMYYDEAIDVIGTSFLKKCTEISYTTITEKVLDPDMTQEELWAEIKEGIIDSLPVEEEENGYKLEFDPKDTFFNFIRLAQFTHKYFPEIHLDILQSVNSNISFTSFYRDVSLNFVGESGLLEAAGEVAGKFSSVEKAFKFWKKNWDRVLAFKDYNHLRSYIHLKAIEDGGIYDEDLCNALGVASLSQTVNWATSSNGTSWAEDVSNNYQRYLDSALNCNLLGWFHSYKGTDVEQLLYKQLLLDTIDFAGDVYSDLF